MKLSRSAEEGVVTGVGARWLRAFAFVVLGAFAVVMAVRRRAPDEPADNRDDVAGEPSTDEFETLVRAELADIPEEFQPYLDNVAIVVEDEPPEPWLGVYQGSTTRYRDVSGKQPDVIRIYRGPMLRNYGHDPDVLAREVRRLVRHEVAHHFGISDARLVELDRY